MNTEKKTKIKRPVTNGVAKVPVVMQMEALECGAASLGMVFAYYGLYLPLEQLRSECGVSRDGSNAKNIMMVAKKHGLDAGGYRMEPDVLFQEGIFPCIVHWEFNHFIVVKGTGKGKVYVNDPARGDVVMTKEQFDEGFTGICLMFEPTEAFEPGGRKDSTLKYALDRLYHQKTESVFLIVTTLISSVTGILTAAFTRIFFDRILTRTNPGWLYPFLTGFSIMALIQLFMAYINLKYSYRINGKMAVVGTTSYMWKVMQMPMEFFSQRMAGDIQSRMQDSGNIAYEIVNTLTPLVLNFITMLFYLIVMFRYNVAMTLIGLSSILVNFFLGRYLAVKRLAIMRVSLRDSGKLSGTMLSGIEMIETIKASGAENGFFGKWAGYHTSVNNQSVRYEKLSLYLGAIPGLVNTIMSAAVVLMGVWLTMQDKFTLGMVSAFQGILMLFTGPALNLIDSTNSIQELGASIGRVEDVMRYPEDPNVIREDVKEDEAFEKLTGSIVMKNITFGYSKLASPLIEDFNLELKPGSRVAFVGSSGCGKSTLAKLISGLYNPWSGEILYDGKKITEIDRSVFNGSLAVVDQDIIMFEDTISANIRMWDTTIEDFEVIMAARDAQIHEDIMGRDGGYNYKLIEGGKDFSGGQRQRMEIARVLAQDPTIIILDEATSALDAKTEFDVVQSIRDRGITCIVVAHRLSTIRDCDEIIVMDRGKVVERGTHDELFALGGRYTELVSNE